MQAKFMNNFCKSVFESFIMKKIDCFCRMVGISWSEKKNVEVIPKNNLNYSFPHWVHWIVSMFSITITNRDPSDTGLTFFKWKNDFLA